MRTSMIYLLPQLVERAALDAPDGPALRFRGQELTYSELLARSAALANGLIEDGLSAGDRVGILLNKGFESAIALYGIMLAGGVYVPLDPFAPPARTEFVIRDCDIRRLVSGPRQAATIQHLADSRVELETVFGLAQEAESPYGVVSWSEIDRLSTEAPALTTTELDLCYILYTSGSTGSPKGIMHTHRSALSWAEVSAAAYRLGPSDVISNYAPLHFDLSTLDYFGGAKAGATTVIIPEEVTKFPASLAGLIEDEQLTVLYTVPMALVQLAEPGVLDGRDLSRLRLVLFGGEPVPIKHLRRMMRSLPAAEFVNVYGPTETNGCIHHRVEAVPFEEDEAIPIGLPYPNVEVLVVDGRSVPVPAGEPGELLVRTPTMMRGYWGREDLNDGAFYHRNPFGGLPEIFHRTGDLVQTQADGALRFIGRKDRQIKFRGYRVELDEIEAVLMTHPSVREAAVYTMPDTDGSLEIRAEVIAGSTTAASADLVRHLGTALPPYAVPVTVGVRDEFPRTSTGKIDRLAMQAQAAANVAPVGG